MKATALLHKRPRRASISLKRDPALHAKRVLIGSHKFVYVLVADRRLKYARGRSRIAYIGTTRAGSSRVAQSVAARAEQILGIHGVRSFDAHIVSCAPRQRVKMWLKLEQSLLIAFRERFGSVPRCNVHGKNMKATDHFLYFSKQRATDVVASLS
jgi:hypothetical protein